MNEIQNLFDSFGVTRYHSNGVFGQNVSIMVIDTGMESSRGAFVQAHKHGLAVSAIICPPENMNGFQGIAPKARVELIDVRDSHSIPIDKILKALQKAIDTNVDIISISLGTPDSWGPLEELIAKANQRGILVFAAAGNAGDRGYEYPAACEHAISVASINSARQPSSFNTRNDAVVIFAPGEDVRLPFGQGGAMETFNGTSFATPFAAGLAALHISSLRSQNATVKVSRAEIIKTLRGEDHLQLNCTTHSYVMEKTCTDFPPRIQEKKNSSVALFIGGFILLALCLITYKLFK